VSEYHAFASFTVAATPYYVGTVDELRGGHWYDGVLVTAPQLAMTFGDDLSLTRATNVDLAIGANAGSAYRALAANNILDGTQVTVALVMRAAPGVGENVYTQILTIVGVTMQPSQIILHLQDIEEQKLQSLYPPNTWQSADWPELSSDDAGKPICEPVGTALKFPCVPIRGSAIEAAYYYGVCAGTPKIVGIYNLSAASKLFIAAGDITGMLVVGASFLVVGSSANDGRYTIAVLSYSAGFTYITVNETVPSNTVNGSFWFMPSAQTVYRNKRIVSASEYAQHILYQPLTVVNGNFASGFANWTTYYYTTAGGYVTTNPGTGCSLTTGAGGATITSVSSTNAAFLSKSFAVDGGTARAGGLYAIEVAVAAGGADAIIYEYNAIVGQVYWHLLPAGKTTTVIMQSVLSVPFFNIGVYNYAGTTTVTGVRCIPLNLRVLKFSVPQYDFNGSLYQIEADALGVESRNASGEVQRLLTLAGASADTTSFNAAIAASFAQTIDCDYGRSGQRRLDAILDDLLYIARGGLSRNSAGAYTIWQDDPGTASLTLDESAADAVNVSKFECTAQPSSVGINYAPSSADANQMQVTLTRPVTGGILAAETPRDIRYLRDATTADQLVCYRALRRWRNRTAVAAIYSTQVNIGDIVAITSPRNWPAQKTFTAWNIRRVKSGNELALREYDAAVYTYTAGTLPPNAPTGYQPDYSFTPPAAPSAVAVTATSARVNNDGTTQSYATVQALPPAVNWAQVWFAAVHNVTGEITLGNAASIGGGNYGCTLGPLRPGEVYKLQCWAVNGNGVQGVVQTTFSATAIGGGAAVTTFTSAGQTAAPATVASITATQGSGKVVQVTWPTVTGTNIAQYVVERQLNAGVFSKVYAGNATTFADTNVGYSGTYTYRVRAQDTYGNFSAAYATSAAVGLVANITGGTSGNDIAATTVATANRTNATTISSTYTVGSAAGTAPWITFNISHSLGRIPILGAVKTTNANMMAAPNNVSTTTIWVTVFGLFSSGTAVGGGSTFFTTFDATINSTPNTHNHNMSFAVGSGTATIDIW